MKALSYPSLSSSSWPSVPQTCGYSTSYYPDATVLGNLKRACDIPVDATRHVKKGMTGQVPAAVSRPLHCGTEQPIKMCLYRRYRAVAIEYVDELVEIRATRFPMCSSQFLDQCFSAVGRQSIYAFVEKALEMSVPSSPTYYSTASGGSFFSVAAEQCRRFQFLETLITNYVTRKASEYADATSCLLPHRTSHIQEHRKPPVHPAPAIVPVVESEAVVDSGDERSRVKRRAKRKVQSLLSPAAKPFLSEHIGNHSSPPSSSTSKDVRRRESSPVKSKVASGAHVGASPGYKGGLSKKRLFSELSENHLDEELEQLIIFAEENIIETPEDAHEVICSASMASLTTRNMFSQGIAASPVDWRPNSTSTLKSVDSDCWRTISMNVAENLTPLDSDHGKLVSLFDIEDLDSLQFELF
jgi:hypothetical protein